MRALVGPTRDLGRLLAWAPWVALVAVTLSGAAVPRTVHLLTCHLEPANGASACSPGHAACCGGSHRSAPRDDDEHPGDAPKSNDHGGSCAVCVLIAAWQPTADDASDGPPALAPRGTIDPGPMPTSLALGNLRSEPARGPPALRHGTVL